MKKYFPSSELIINEDGSVFHLHVKPEWLADKVILVGDPGRVALVASHFENKECEVESREFKTITGTYKGKRITVVSTGIGCDNIDIVMNELDALANIDFVTREEKDQFRQLELVRIGTCGGLQPNTPVGTFVCSQKSIGFDGLLNFYAGRNAVCDLPFERAFLNHMGWSGNICAPAPARWIRCHSVWRMVLLIRHTTTALLATPHHNRGLGPRPAPQHPGHSGPGTPNPPRRHRAGSPAPGP